MLPNNIRPGLGSIPELELELMPIPILIPGIGIEKELNKRNWNWKKGIEEIDSIPFSYRQFLLIFCYVFQEFSWIT